MNPKSYKQLNKLIENRLNEANEVDALQAANAHITNYMAYGYTSTIYKIEDQIKKINKVSAEMLQATKALLTLSDKIKSLHGGSTDKILKQISGLRNIIAQAKKQCNNNNVRDFEQSRNAATELQGHVATIDDFINTLEKICKG